MSFTLFQDFLLYWYKYRAVDLLLSDRETLVSRPSLHPRNSSNQIATIRTTEGTSQSVWTHCKLTDPIPKPILQTTHVFIYSFVQYHPWKYLSWVPFSDLTQFPVLLSTTCRTLLLKRWRNRHSPHEAPRPGGGSSSTGGEANAANTCGTGGIADPSTPPLQVRCGAVGGVGGMVGGVSRHQISMSVALLESCLYSCTTRQTKYGCVRTKRRKLHCTSLTLRHVCRKLKKEATDKSVLPWQLCALADGTDATIHQPDGSQLFFSLFF